MISIEDFKKVELTVGEIKSAEKIPDTDKLLKLSVDFGEGTPRQVVSGIALHFPDPSGLISKKCLFVTNLEPREIRGFASNAMIVAVSTDTGAFSLCEVAGTIPAGIKAR